MTIKFREKKIVLRDINYTNKNKEPVTIYNVPFYEHQFDHILSVDEDHFEELIDFIEKHNIESLDWQDWTEILEEGVEMWERSLEYYKAYMEDKKARQIRKDYKGRLD